MLFPKELCKISNTSEGEIFIQQQFEKWYTKAYAKLCIDYKSINPLRESIKGWFEKYKEYLDYDFINSFQRKNTISHLAELLSFKILEDNNLEFVNTKTKKNSFPDIETKQNEIFEITTIEVEQEKYWWLPLKSEIIHWIWVKFFNGRNGDIKTLDEEECLKFTSKIYEKNSDFLKKWINGNIIVFSHWELVSGDRIISKVLYWNYLESITKKGELRYIWFNDFSKNTSELIIPPITRNSDIISNCRSVLLIWDSSYNVLSNIIDGKKTPFVFWKNPEFEVDFDLKL